MKAPKVRRQVRSLCVAYGFSLLELLVVLAVIVVLAALVLATLGNAKSKGRAVQCIGNLKQLQLAWHLYAHDHSDRLVPNSIAGGVSARPALMAPAPSWVVGNAFLDETMTNIQRGLLFSYANSPIIYRCPADRSTVRDEGRIQRNRTYSLSCYMNGVGHFPDGGGALLTVRDRIWRNMNSIRNPAEAFVFVDEHENSVASPMFPVNLPGAEPIVPPLWSWVTFPATRHSQGSNLSFADGHVEHWRWQEVNTLSLAKRNPPLHYLRAVEGSDRDLKRFFKAIPQLQ